MTAIKVWGIILIVVSVLLILGGIQHYRELAVAEVLVRASIDSIPRQVKTWFWSPAEEKTYATVIRNKKILSILSCLLGVCLGLLGTLMIRDDSPVRYVVRIEKARDPYPEKDEVDQATWKF
jgi:hypothetical protein